MDELDIEIALDRIITEFIIRLATRVTERQTRIDSFLLISGLSLTGVEIDSLAATEGVVRVQLEAMERDLLRSFRESVNTGAQLGREGEQKRQGKELLTWQTESAKPCPDCVARSGQTGSPEYWDAVGRPGAGATICGGSCKCVLV